MRHWLMFGLLLGACGGDDGSSASLAAIDGEGNPTGTAAFAQTAVGQHARATVTIVNTGSATSGELEVGLVGNAEIAIAMDNCAGKALGTNARCSIVLDYAPTTPTVNTTSLVVSAMPGGIVKVDLTGESVAAALSLAVQMPDLGPLAIGTTAGAVVDVTNVSTLDVPLTNLAVTGAGFVLTATGCGATLAATATCSIQVTATASALGHAIGTVSVDGFGLPYSKELSFDGAVELTVQRVGAGAGTVTSTAIDCGTTCTTLVTADQTLTAAAGNGSTFAGWSVGACGTNATCPITLGMTPITVQARFVSIVGLSATAPTVEIGTSEDLVVTVSNTGGAPAPLGAIGATGEYMIKSKTCGASLAAGNTCTITLDALPTALGVRAGMLTIDIDGVPRTQALAAIGASRLTIARDGTGTGTVTSVPAGIDCGPVTTSCTALFTGAIDLTATPEADSTVAAWSVGGCTGTTCNVPAATTARTATVTFDLL